MQFSPDAAFAQHLDAQDPLRPFADRFLFPKHNGQKAIYFLGNSLGLQPKSTKAHLQKVLDQWEAEGVESFFKGDDPWLQMHDRLQGPIANIVGAKPEEIVVMNALTVNLHLMLASFYHPQGSRKKIICEAKAFPSDQYMLQTHLEQRGLNPDEVIVEVQPRGGEHCIRHEDIITAIEKTGDELAMLFWGGVNYYTGQVFDMATLTAAAKKASAVVGFDLAHAAGNIPLQLHNWDVDFACWCSYKYLNSGPGAVGGVFIHEQHHNSNLPRLGGWWGYKKEDRFLMQKGFVPINNAEGWQQSTPSPLQYAAHEATLRIFEEAGMENIAAKSRLLADYLHFLLSDVIQQFPDALHVITPSNASQRGSQVSMLVPKIGKQVFDALADAGVYADWREPDVIRIAPVPLYNSFLEVHTAIQILKSALANFVRS